MGRTTNRNASRTKRRATPRRPLKARIPGKPQKTVPPAHASKSWELYHLLGAAAIVMGVFAAAHSASDLVQHLQHMNSVEESGFAAALTVCLRGIGSMMSSLVVGLGAFMAWLSRLGK